MATPPPLNPQQPRRLGCGKGCFLVAAIGFAALVFLGFLGNFLSEQEWKRERASIVSSIEQAVNCGDYEKALSLAEPHKSRNDPELKGLVTKAQDLKREELERFRQKKITALIAEIGKAEGDERKGKLEQLLRLDPDTKEFPDELASVRAKIKQHEEEARAKRKAERQAELKRKEEARQEQARLAMEAKLAEFKWRYQVSTDQLTSKPTYTAWVKSLNQVSFDFPYQGIQRGQLILRTHPQYGKDLILQVEKGQMLVRSYEDTSVKVVFDDRSPVSYRVVGPADHGTTSMFFRDYHGFVGRMLKAKKMKISVPFYQQGNVVFEFNISDFDSGRYLNKN